MRKKLQIRVKFIIKNHVIPLISLVVLSRLTTIKSIFRHYCIQNVKDGIQIQVYNINNESVNHFSQFISVKVKNNLRKSQAQFQEKLNKLRLKQNDGFLIKKSCISFKSVKSFLLTKSFYTIDQFSCTV